MDIAASHTVLISFATCQNVLNNHTVAAFEARSLRAVTTLAVVHHRAATEAAVATRGTVSTAERRREA